MTMYDLSILIPTYKRPKILLETIYNLIDHLVVIHGARLHFHVGVDGRDEETYEALENRARKEIERHDYTLSVHDGPGKGLGANLNMLLSMVETYLILQLDDDHVLARELHIFEHAKALLEDPEMQGGWIRLMYGRCIDPSGYYHFTAKLHGKYWRLLPNEGELYLPSNRPHIKHVDFHGMVGPYSEGTKLGHTEISFCAQYANYAKRSIRPPGVFIPMYPPPEDTWMHVGNSWQKEGL